MTQTPQGRIIDNWLLLLLGLGALPSVKIVGYITITEIILLVIGPLVVLQRSPLLKDSIVRWFLGFIVLWLASAIFADFYRHVEFNGYIRGWAKVVMLGWAILVFYLLLKSNPRAYRYFLVGLTLSAVLVIYYGRVGIEDYEAITGQKWEDSWETTYVYIVLYGAMAVATFLWQKRPWLTAAILSLAGCTTIALGSRAPGGVLLMAAGTALYLRFNTTAQQMIRGDLDWKKYLGLAALFFLSGYSILLLYGELASRGVLGEKAENKYILQSEGRFGLIISGRINVIGAGLALMDSPVIGYGSWAQDNNGYFYRAFELLGYDPREVATDQTLYANRIPTHSYILEAWVEHGLLAAGFWFFTLWFMVKFVKRLLFMEPTLMPVMCIQLWLFLWNMFFSPLGVRSVVGGMLAGMIVLYDDSLKRRQPLVVARPQQPNMQRSRLRQEGGSDA